MLGALQAAGALPDFFGLPLPFFLIVSMIERRKRDFLGGQRYLPGSRGLPAPKSTEWRLLALPQHDILRRPHFLRMSDKTLNALMALDRRHCRGVFKKKKGPRVMRLRAQLQIGLRRLGPHGNGSSVRRAAALFGTSEGNVAHARSRFIKALIALAPRLIKWPSENEREELAEHGSKNGAFEAALAPRMDLKFHWLGLLQQDLGLFSTENLDAL